MLYFLKSCFGFVVLTMQRKYEFCQAANILAETHRRASDKVEETRKNKKNA